MAPKGSMTTEIFVSWLKHFSLHKQNGPVLLIMDGASSHLDYSIVEKANEIDVILFCLPSNTTHELQPLDKSVFRSFEHHWDEQLLKFWDNSPERQLTKERFGIVFKPVWEKSMTIANISSGFRATGIYPFDEDAIHESAFAPSIITEGDIGQGPNRNQDFADDVPVSSDSNDIQPLELRKEPGESNDVERPASAETPVPGGSNANAPSTPVSPFGTYMPTPKKKMRLRNLPLRRKAVNYKAQVVTQGLFQKRTSGPAKNGATKCLETNRKKKTGAARKSTETSASAEKSTEESWFCSACNENRQEDMRSCKICGNWFHEICVGMVPEDTDDFVCPCCD